MSKVSDTPLLDIQTQNFVSESRKFFWKEEAGPEDGVEADPGRGGGTEPALRRSQLAPPSQNIHLHRHVWYPDWWREPTSRRLEEASTPERV